MRNISELEPRIPRLPVLSTTERNDLLGSTPSPIAACTTVSAEYLQRAQARQALPFFWSNLGDPEYFYLESTPEVFLECGFNYPCASDFFAANSKKEIFIENEEYGGCWVVGEVLMEGEIAPSQIIGQDILNDIAELHLVAYGNSGPSFQMRNIEKLQELLDNVRYQGDFITRMQNRKGVQLLFANTPEFCDFLQKSSKYIHDGSTLQITRTPHLPSIPLRLLHGIVPLGAYEQQIFS